MIGYYIHHQGRGHLHRAQALAHGLEETVTGLSSLPCPSAWQGPWVQLPRDDDLGAPTDTRVNATVDTTAGDQLHWVPQGDPGLRDRAASLSSWLAGARPRLVVVDVSVEVALLIRLHGVPVVSMVLPGRRVDPAHLLGFRISAELIAAWPARACGMTPGLPDDIAARVRCVGAISRFPVVPTAPRRPGPPRVVVLQGQGGGVLTSRTGESLRRLAPAWEWRYLGGCDGWVEDPSSLLRDADVVVTNAGQGSLAEVAACRRPAVVIPAQRPHDEQATTAAVLEAGPWPALVLPSFPNTGWPQLLEQAAVMDGNDWHDWCDGRAATRFVDLVTTPTTHLWTA